ncbi:PAS domain S-box protein [Pedobacter gandavensis]|uniref:PAS domain-containing protein n=1 Tax=Pedobacter gandavensis TaxID=2679963 RepID=UPI00247900A2|nr:PAS domain-containing hybrid sensor histidine kinase/response regulator [Pedobacter gandavensis]WGQ09602.1 PAS domain S-box protein [Pedobacter gandavensis]
MGIIKRNEVYTVNSAQERLIPLLMAYQQAVDTSIISSITDVKGTIIHVNQRFCEVSKFSRQELLGQNHRIINSGFHPKEFLKKMWSTIGKGQVWHGEIKNQAKDGSYYWVDSVIVPIKDAMGKPVQYLSLRTLISERKEKEEKDREDQVNAMEEMLFKISHELRQPVVKILGLSDLIDDSRNAPEDLKIIVEGIKESAIMLDNYTRELAGFVHKIRNEQDLDAG